MALATLVWSGPIPVSTGERPMCAEVSSEQEIINMITKIQSYVYNLQYLLIEFDGYIYNLTEPNGENAMQLIRAMIANGMEP